MSEAPDEAREREEHSTSHPNDGTTSAPAPEDAAEEGAEPTEEELASPAGDDRAVGEGEYVVRQGECVASIACEVGHFWQTIWDEPANEPVKEARQDPYVLYPGDRLVIPDKRRKDEPGETEMRHRFVRRGAPEKLVIHFEINDEPRANEDYVLTIDGRETPGTTDPDGRVEIKIPPNARQGKIVFTESGDTYDLNLGHMDPITTTSGVQARLKNLGYYDGPIDGREGPKLEAAVQMFQDRHELAVTGTLDDGGRQLLEQEHGS